MICEIRKLLLLATFVYLAAAESQAKEFRFDGVGKVVAIADVHGAYDAMIETLQQAGILDSEIAWAGAESHLVIVGDILDRGPDSRAAMDLLMRLEGEAESAGGNVHVLIGNHEAMILTGDMRYVSAAEYAAFSAEEDAAEREHWLKLYAEQQEADLDEVRAVFDRNYPPGYFAMRRAFRPGGHYGEWLLKKNAIAVINGTAFVHGGLPPLVTRVGLDHINGAMMNDLANYAGALTQLYDAGVLLPTDSHYNYEKLLENFMPSLAVEAHVLTAKDEALRLLDSELTSTDGPFWYRNNILCPRIVEQHRLDAALAKIGANRLVVGHTPTPTRTVMQRFNGRLIEIDTGMLEFYYNGKGHALILQGDEVSIVSQTGDTGLLPVNQQRVVGKRPGGLSADDLAVLLETGKIVSIDEVTEPVTRTVVTVSDGENTIKALLNRVRGRGFYPSVAAYRLDRLLQLDMVPVTVAREVEGRRASLQFFPERVIDETERSATGQGGGAWCSISDQWPAMYVFDALIFNEGRVQSRMLYDTSTWRLILSQHDRAFSTRKGRPPHLKNAPIVIDAGWGGALEQLQDDVLQSELSDVLDKKRMRALLSRRDELLASRADP